MSTTYQTNHLANLATTGFDPAQSWILTSTSKPFPTSSSPASSTPAPSLLNDLNAPSVPTPSLPLPSRFLSSPPCLSSPPHPLYHTSSSLYGRRPPEGTELPSVYFGHQMPFSSAFSGGMYRASGLDTGVRKSRVVNGKEELGW